MISGGRRCTLLALALWALTPFAHAGQVPAIRPGEKPAPGSTEAELWYGMGQSERELKDAPVIVRDPALNAYVRDVACRVVGDYCGDLRVYIVESPVFNASMAPNGAMIVFTGALLRMQDESELALVLGHEFAHYRQRHSLRMWTNAKSTSALSATFTIMSGFSLAGGVVQMLGAAGLSGFSRDMEREADQLGFSRATELHYDPTAGTRVWARMLREEQANKRRRGGSVFASHPRTAERLQDITAAAANAPADAGTERRMAAYRAAMRPFLARWLDAELSRRMYDTSIQVIEDRKAGASEDEAGLLAYYLAEAYRRRGGATDAGKAADLYAEAIRHPDAPATAWREQGHLLRAAGQPAAAAAAFREYLGRAPAASDRAFIEQDLKALEATTP